MAAQTLYALAHARTIVADGYPTLGGSGGGHGGKNSISDPTANAALNRTTGTGAGYRVADQVQLLEHNLGGADVVALELARVGVADLGLEHHAGIAAGQALRPAHANGAGEVFQKKVHRWE